MPRFALRAVLLAFVVAALSGCGHTPAIDTGTACLAELDAHADAYRPIVMGEPANPQCRIATPIKLSQLDVPLNRPATMSCLLAARLDEFERGAVQKLAREDLGQYVVRLDHLGAYSCRANTGRRERLSEHAYGLAIDISGFRLSDGTTVSVARDWKQPGPKSAFLHHFARAACEYFSVVLTPDSNADHLNHFHLDIGPDRLCSV